MARSPKPWFREDRGAYFVTISGTRHNLGEDKAEADRQFHLLMAGHNDPRAPAQKPPGGLTVAEVFDKFLDWCQTHRSPRTFEWAKGHIQSFCDYPPTALMPTTGLRPYHVVEWVDSKPTWGVNQKRGAIVAVTRPFNWAAKMGYIDASPVRGVEKPQPRSGKAG